MSRRSLTTRAAWCSARRSRAMPRRRFDRVRTDRSPLESLDFGVSVDFGMDEPLLFDGRLDLVKTAIARFLDKDASGFDLYLHSSAPPGSGLGVVLGDDRRPGRPAPGPLPADDDRLRDRAPRLRARARGARHLAAVCRTTTPRPSAGSTTSSSRADHVVVNPLRIDRDVINELEHNLLLCYTGRTRLSDHIIDDQTERYRRRDTEALDGLRRAEDAGPGDEGRAAAQPALRLRRPAR